MLLRFTLLAFLSAAIPALWYVASRAWFESGSGLFYTLFFPQSALVFVWPLLGVASVWWVLAPRPRASLGNFLFLPAAVVGGLPIGLFLGLMFTCEYLNKCM
jgi:hypothetical protein